MTDFQDCKSQHTLSKKWHSQKNKIKKGGWTFLILLPGQRHISATVADLHGPDLTKKTEEKRINKTNQQWFQSYLYVDRNKTWDNSASTSIQKTLKLRLRWGCGVGAVTVFHEYFTRTPIKSNIRLLTFHPRTNANKTPGEENKPRTNARREKSFPPCMILSWKCIK